MVECLLLEEGADREAVVKQDGWDPEITARGVFGHGGILDEYGDSLVEMKLAVLFHID